jgi:glycosyltransferase involved in cell wall biosynthesis
MAPVSEPAALAVLGGFLKPRPSLPQGTIHAAYQICQALARTGRFVPLHIYHDPGRTPAGELAAPAGAVVFDRSLLRSSRQRYAAIYVANGGHMTSSPHLLRPDDTAAPLVCSVGTAHNPGQWSHLLLALASGAIRATDGWIFKSRAAEGLFRATWADWARRFGLEAAPALTTVIPNGVDVDENQRSEALRAETRARLRLSERDLVFLSFSRLSPGTKGDQQALIVRWREVVAAVPNATLLLAGAVVDRGFVADLRALARAAGVADRVLVLDDPAELASDARLRLMSAADVFVHLSTGIEETSPLVVHEALAHALPVIATSWAGLPEIIQQGETGYLIGTRHAPVSPFLAGTIFAQSELVQVLAASRVVAIDWPALVTAARACAEPGHRRALAQAARRAAEARALPRIAEAYADFFLDTGREAARAFRPTAITPLIELEAVLAAQAGGSLSPGTRVRLGASERATLVASGVLAEPPERVDLVLAALATREHSLAELAALLLPEDPERAYAVWGRLLVRLLNFGVMELV